MLKGFSLAGVICGGFKTNKWFIENSREHAELIIKKLILNGLTKFLNAIFG